MDRKARWRKARQHNSAPNTHIDYGFRFLEPTARIDTSEVKGVQQWPAETNNHYPLQTFCLFDGKCINCKSNKHLKGGTNSRTVKPILCDGPPRFVQSLVIKCWNCNKTFSAYENTYVDTLSLESKQALNATIAGRAYGIDMGLIQSLKNGADAYEIERAARANARAKWGAAKAKYEKREEHSKYPFPTFPEEYVPKAAQMKNALKYLRRADCTSSEPTLSNEKPMELDLSGLSPRQQVARKRLTELGISLEKYVNEHGKRKMCNDCFKNRDDFECPENKTKHLTINQAKKGTKIVRYCPLVDPPDLYFEVLAKRRK